MQLDLSIYECNYQRDIIVQYDYVFAEDIQELVMSSLFFVSRLLSRIQRSIVIFTNFVFLRNKNVLYILEH